MELDIKKMHSRRSRISVFCNSTAKVPTENPNRNVLFFPHNRVVLRGSSQERLMFQNQIMLHVDDKLNCRMGRKPLRT